MTFSPSSSFESPPCDHAEHNGKHCAFCQKPVCLNCSAPISDDLYLCHECAAKAEQIKQSQEQGIGNQFTLINYQKAPLTILFCLFLCVIYFVSILPVWPGLKMAFLVYGNLDPKAIIEFHQYWRLITANLLHLNLMHLGANVFSLLIFGELLEVQTGWGMLILWMVLSLVACDIATLLFDVPHSIGASGIAYGLQTAFIVLSAKVLVQNRMGDFKKTFQSLVGYLILIVVLNLMYTSEVNAYGHFGGVIAGLVGALIYPVTRPLAHKDYLKAFGVLGVFVAILVWVIQAHVQLS